MIEIIPNWHPIFVHFTVALVTAALLFLVLARLTKADGLKGELTAAGRWTIRLAALITLITVAAGFWAYMTVAHDEPAHHAMEEHRNWAIAAGTIIVLLGVWSVLRGAKTIEASNAYIVGLAAAFVLVTITAFEGAELVYEHGLGVESLPNVTGEGHHHHGDADADEDHDHDADDADHHDDDGDADHDAAPPTEPDGAALHNEGAAGPEDGPLGAVRAFHAALETGDRAGVAAYLAPDVVIYESGGVERSLAEYEDHHLAADIEFAAATDTSVLSRYLIPQGETAATVVSETHTTGRFGDRAIDSHGTETVTLTDRQGSWVIDHIHWSSR